MKEQKKLLRKQVRFIKSQQDPSTLTANSQKLLEWLEKHPRFIAARTILLYHSLSDEVQTHDFIEKWYTQKEILLPVVLDDELKLRHYTGKECLSTGCYQIEEPQGDYFINYREIELAIVPGMSFDRQGNRLGRGKGYYDKLLPKLQSYNIGICFEFQVQEHIPTESFDRPMDEVWTENGRLH